MGFPAADPTEKFWRCLERTAGCWLWLASTNSGGYGMLRTGKKNHVAAHRYSWELANGPIPDGLWVLHKCDVPLCVNPDHLFLGTHADNMADMAAKGRARGGGDKVRGSANGRAKLTEAAIAEILRSDAPAVALGHRFGVDKATIRSIKRGIAWRHVSRGPDLPDRTSPGRRQEPARSPRQINNTLPQT